MFLVVQQFSIPTSGNSELEEAFDAAIMQLEQSNKLNMLYNKYFGLNEDVDASVFENAFNKIITTEPDFFIYPVSFENELDCSPEAINFPELSKITLDGSLSNVLTSRKLYVLRSLDAPGFHPTVESKKIYSSYDGYEEELLDYIVKELSVYYLHEQNAIKIIYDEKSHKTTEEWKSEYNFEKGSTNSKSFKVTSSTSLSDFANSKRKYHVSSGGLLESELTDLGNFGCGEMLAEIGLMVNYQALQGLYELSGRTQNEYALFRAKIDAATSPEDIFLATSTYLENGVNLPVCTKENSVANYLLESEFSFCDEKCHFENYLSTEWTSSMKNGPGAWDQFINGKCVLFAADTTTMLSLYKQLKDGIEKGIFDESLLKYEQEIKYKYLFAFSKNTENTEIFEENMDNKYALNAYQVSLTYEMDDINFKQGNSELMSIMDYFLSQWAQKLASPYETEYGKALKENFVEDKDNEEFVLIKNLDWIKSSTFGQFNAEQRRNINKIYNRVKSSELDIDDQLTAAIAKLKESGLTSFTTLLEYVDSSVYKQYPISGRQVLLYSIFVDQLIASKIYASVTGVACDDPAKACNEVLIGKNDLFNELYKKFSISPESLNINFANDENIFERFSSIEYIPGTFVVSAFENFNKAVMRYKNQEVSSLTPEMIMESVLKSIANITANIYYPDFIFITNEFVTYVNNITADATIKTIEQIVSSAYHNLDPRTLFSEKYTALFTAQLLFKDETRVSYYENEAAVAEFSRGCKGSTEEDCYIYHDYAQGIAYEEQLRAQTNLKTLTTATEFTIIGNMYPLAYGAVSKAISTSSLSSESFSCAIRQATLAEIPQEYNKFFPADLSVASATLLCVQFNSLPTALTSSEVTHPITDAQDVYGAFQYIRSRRILKIGSYNAVKGFHTENSTGLEDCFLREATKLFKQHLGTAVMIVSINDYLNQNGRQAILQETDNPDIDIILSAQYTDEAIKYVGNGLEYEYIDYGRNYLTANISVIAHISTKYARYAQTLHLEEYYTENAELKGATFCVAQNSQAQAFFSKFNSQAAVNEFKVVYTTNTQTSLSALAAKSCDFVMAHDTDATPWLLQRSDYVFRSFSNGQMVLSPVFRRDFEGAAVAAAKFVDSAVSSMLTAAIVLLICSIVFLVLLCLGFRTLS